MLVLRKLRRALRKFFRPCARYDETSFGDCNRKKKVKAISISSHCLIIDRSSVIENINTPKVLPKLLFVGK